MDWIKIIGPTALVVIGGIVSWFIQNKIQQLNDLNNHLRDERIDKYNEIIKPILLMYSKNGGGQDKAVKLLQSYDYRKASFELNFWGSDDVIKSFNELMQFVYKINNTGEAESNKKILYLLGNLMLEIRKDIGNKKTDLQPYDMLKSMITDIDQFID